MELFLFNSLGIDNVDEILSKDSSFITFKNKIDQAISISEEKVQLSQRITRLMENSLSRLSNKIDEVDRGAVDSNKAEEIKMQRALASQKKKKEELISSNSSIASQKPVYCICHQV